MNQDVHAQLASAGLILDKPLEYGKLVRCKTEGDKGQKASGWYVLHELKLDNGQTVLVGRFGNWKAGTGEQGLKLEFDLSQISKEERERAAAIAMRAREQALAEQRERQAAAATRAGRIWSKLPDSGSSEYLKRKGVKAWGLRFSRGKVVVPVSSAAGTLVGLQFIEADGGKKFLTGTPKRGAFHLIGFDQGGDHSIVAVGEGYATCATVHEATGWPIAVAFDAGNLHFVAQSMRHRHPTAKIVICADRDAECSPAWGCTACGWLVLKFLGDQPNPRYSEPAVCKCGGVCSAGGPGEIKAGFAASLVMPSAVCVPDFPVGGRCMSLTDWNDLQSVAGRDVVRRQLLEKSEQHFELPSVAPVAAEQSPAPTVDDVGRVGLEEALRRFCWTLPDGRVWDNDDKKLLKPAQLKNWIGEKVYKEWNGHEARRTVQHDDVARLAQAAQRKGGGALGYALRNYVLLYPSQTVWDRERREVIALNDLKPKLHRNYQQWLEHGERQEINRDKLVFDPRQIHREEDGYINMFRGLPLKPIHDDSKCAGIIQLLFHLVNEDQEVFDWIANWVALPLQRPGTKMATAVLMHSEVQGSGKSLFWEGVVKKLYGEYGATLGQHQIESQYTDWRSQKLYGLFEEVLSRDQKYSHTGTLKHMITGSTHRVEKKFVSGWEEANYMNSAFLSNEHQPWPLEPSDRRMQVVWPESKLPLALQRQVDAEINGDGIPAFYGWLLRRQMVIGEWVNETDFAMVPFGPHTKPVATRARERLIEFGRPSWESFLVAWQNEEADVPYCCCITSDLFTAYRRWADKRKESVISHTKFSSLLSTRIRRRRDVRYKFPSGDELKAVFFLTEDPPVAPECGSQAEWLGQQVAKFRQALKIAAGEDHQ